MTAEAGECACSRDLHGMGSIHSSERGKQRSNMQHPRGSANTPSTLITAGPSLETALCHPPSSCASAPGELCPSAGTPLLLQSSSHSKIPPECSSLSGKEDVPLFFSPFPFSGLPGANPASSQAWKCNLQCLVVERAEQGPASHSLFQVCLSQNALSVLDFHCCQRWQTGQCCYSAEGEK